MKLIDLQSAEVTCNLPAAAARAQADIIVAQAALNTAEAGHAAAVAEVARLRARQNALSAESARLESRGREMKRLVLIAVVDGVVGPASDLKEWRKLRAEREEIINALSMCVSFLIPAAERKLLEVALTLGEAAADYGEAKAVAHRLKSALVTAQASEFDPGIALNHEGSWSAAELGRSQYIRQHDLPGLREQLKKLIAATENEQFMIAPGLFGF